jgi:hypothetical protein
VSTQAALTFDEPIYAPDYGRVEKPIYGVAVTWPTTTAYLLDDGLTWASEGDLDARDWSAVFSGCRVQAERKAAKYPGAFVVRCG